MNSQEVDQIWSFNDFKRYSKLLNILSKRIFSIDENVEFRSLEKIYSPLQNVNILIEKVEQLEKEKSDLKDILEETQDILSKCFYAFENQARPNMQMAETVNNLWMKISKLGGGK